MSSVNAIGMILERLCFSEAAATYLTDICGIDSLDEIAYLDGIEDVDTNNKGVTSPGGTVKTRSGATRVTSRKNGIPVSIRAVANLNFLYIISNIWKGFNVSLLTIQSTWFWFAVIATNNVMKFVSRRMQNNLISMAKIGQKP
jgi:hypothetical protein